MDDPIATRRTLLASPLALSACNVLPEILPVHALVIKVEVPSQEAFFEAIRGFARGEHYTLTEQSYAHDLGITRGFILSGWRSEIQIASGRGDREFSATDFQAFFYASRVIELWGLTAEDLRELVNRFEAAINAIDGVEIVSIPQELLQRDR